MKQILCALIFIALVPTAHATPPGIINHQGRIAVGGANFDGTGHFKFALVDGAGTTSFWSNDDSSVGGAEPVASVAVTVSKGHYAVALGETSAIPVRLFADNDDVRLRVWFSQTGGAGSFEQLAPDRTINSTPYALHAAKADGVVDGSVTSAMLADGAVSGLDSPDGSFADVVRATSPHLVPRGFATTNLPNPRAVAIEGDFAYVVDLSSDALQIFEITDPDAIVARGNETTVLSAPAAVTAQGNFVYVVDVGTASLHIFGVSEPSSIVVVDSDSTNLIAPSGVAVQGDFVYVVDNDSGVLQIFEFDVSGPDPIVPRSSIGVGAANDIAVDGDFAYVVDSGNLRIIDISNPDAPDARDTDNTGLTFARSVSVQGNFAYVVDSFTDQLRIFDVSDPDFIKPLGAVGGSLSEPTSVAVNGNFAFVADGGSGLEVFNVSDPEEPVAIDSNGINLSAPKSVAVVGKTAFVTDSGTDRLQAFELRAGVEVSQDLEVVGGRIGVGTSDPAASLHVEGDTLITGALDLESHLVDRTGSAGAAGQVLSANASGTEWVDVSSIVPSGSITSDQIADGAITAADLGTGSVQADAIAPAAVGSSEIATGAVGTAEIANGSITSADMASGLALTVTQLNIGEANGNHGIYFYDAGNPTERSLIWKDSENRFVFDGALALSGPLNAGSGGDNMVRNYNAFSNTSGAVPTSGQITTSGDVYIRSDLEVGGAIYGTIAGPSDRNIKEHFEEIDPAEILDKVAALPLTTWQYIDRHEQGQIAPRHLGPMAQDFHAAFQLGNDERYITSVDADGVALAAIQGLNAKLEAENAELRARLSAIEEFLKSHPDLQP